MELKDYQTQTLNTLRRFLENARVEGSKAAYGAIVTEPEMAKRLKGFAGSYKALNTLDETPYVCLRLPTGGGKTLLAAHAVNIAKEAWIERDFPLVLWLVPTTTIRKQTVDALKNPRHPYRAALDDAFNGRVRVFDIGDFTQLMPHDLRSNCCVVVATIQTLRVKDTEGRRVYAHHEMLEPHFTGLPDKMPGLEVIETGNSAGTIKFSFANLMHLHQPLMIVDEAHKAVTGLSREMQSRVNPTAIIEFTATPRTNSNILHSVSAQELKDEEMIKLPVMLSEHQTWQAAVTGAISKRGELAEDARRERDYIRPLVLFQAQNKDEEVTVAVLKQHLIDVEGIDAHRIAVATGDQRELDGINLFDPACEIDFIITVEALKEGWDCSFAYVFCSVANIHSATDAEQLLGRVLRMFVKHADQSAQLLLDIPVEGWSEQTLVLFLDRQVRDKFIGQGELVRWLSDLVSYLTSPRNIPLSALMQCKYPLARKVKERIADIRAKERTGVYQRSLFAPEAKSEISFDNGFVFADDMFAGVRTYRGSYRFSKHFTGWDQVAAFDGADDGEELTCAKMLDSLPEVKHWIRNVPRHPGAFWLPTASGGFYPDFVAELTDGRILVVEYKGAHLTDAADTDEKRAIGALWEKASGGKGLFLMAEKQVDGKDVRNQMLAKAR